MEKRRLGSTDLSLSVLGLGCWQFGGGSYWGKQSQDDVNQVVHQALDGGVNFFDTAEIYNDGESEISLGIALRGRRNEAIIGSKIHPPHMSPDQLRMHCDASLKRLQTDYLDLYMVHWPLHPSQNIDFDEAFMTLYQLKQEGKIRHIGLSNHGTLQLQQVHATGVPIACNELAYNLLSRAIELELMPVCLKQQLGIIAYMPLQQGILSGKYNRLDEIKPLHARTRHFHYRSGEGSRHGEAGAETQINMVLQQLKAVSAELGVSMATLSLAWVIGNPAVTTTIVGSRNIEQLETNMQGSHLKLSPDVMRSLNQMTEPVLVALGANPDYYESQDNSRIF
jgi:myo-inositol catabolism protein IolS